MEVPSTAESDRIGFRPAVSHEYDEPAITSELRFAGSPAIVRAMLRTFVSLICILSPALPAAAASSTWVKSGGGAVRIVTSGLSDKEGLLRGAIEIRLEPGWKTYWRDPGEAGIPPRLHLSAASDASAAELLFPPPERISNPYATWAGYSRPVSFPVLFRLGTPRSAGIIEGTLFVGVCETICVPVEAPFSFDAGADPDNPQDAMVVTAAFAELPAPASEDFRISAVSQEEGHLVFQSRLPEDAAEASLFLAAPEGLRVGPPEIVSKKDGAATFSASLLSPLPSGAVEIDYTLTADGDAVAGTVTLRE